MVLLVSGGWFRAAAQYDKVAGLGSDNSTAPIGGPASAPPIENWPYDLPDFRPTGRLNDALPKWLRFGLEERLRLEGYSGGSYNPANRDAYLLNRFRFGMAIQPASWFRIITQVQDARSLFEKPPLGPPNQVRWDLKLAYAEFGNLDKQTISIRVGRQQLDYNNTIIANSEWRNQGRSYDGVVTNIHVDRFRLGIFAGSVVEPLDEGLSHHQQGNNIYGLYGAIDRILPNSLIEPFVLWRVAPKVAVEGNTIMKTGKLDEKAYGFRLRGKNLGHLDYRFELVGESGAAGSNGISAWATTFGAGYRLRSAVWKPRFFAGYDYASGDRNPRDGTRNTFDTMYPTAHDRFGITDQFGWQNIIAGRGGFSFQPHHRWSITAQYLNFWLASATDAAYNTSGVAVVRDPAGKSGAHLGQELDAYTWYEINREVHIGVGLGHLIPGEFITKLTGGASYTYPYFAIEMLDGQRVH